MRKFLGTVLALTGLLGLLTINENPEMPESFTRTVIALLICLGLFILGAWLARMFDGQTEENGYSKQDDHNPYPEE